MQISDYKNLNTAQYYIGYPHDALPALTKWYCESGPPRLVVDCHIADFPTLTQTWSRLLVRFTGHLEPGLKADSADPFAVYIQQILVLHIEERRKDYVQMFAHHIITTLLMSFSYVFNYTRVGNAILCTMDLVDIILSVRTLSVSLTTAFDADTCSHAACQAV